MINANALSPHRKSVGNPGSRIMSIRNVVNQSHVTAQQLKQSELSKIKKYKGQFDNIKEKVQGNVDHQDTYKKKIKYKLNVDTDSEDEVTPDNTQTTAPKNVKEVSQKGYLDAQMTLGAEQTKAKQNTNLLFNNFDKNQSILPAKLNLKKIIQNDSKGPPLSSPTTQQLSLGHTYSLNQPQVTLANQGSSTTGNPYFGENTGNIKGVGKIPNSGGLNNSYYDENPNIGGEENMCYLKGLTQNQNLPNNCELTEYVENDRITIGIKTTDFFTFIRLQDEVDELRRKHLEFQYQKQLIQQQKNQQNQAINSKMYQDNEGLSPNHFNQQNLGKSNQKFSMSMSLKNANMTTSQKMKQNIYGVGQNQDLNNLNDIDPKKEGQKFYSFYVARKYGLKWHQIMTQKARSNKQHSNIESKAFQKHNQSVDSNVSYRSSINEINQNNSNY